MPHEQRSPHVKALRTIGIALGIAAAAFIAFGFMLPDTPETRERAHSREVIRSCWHEQERKSLSPEAARFVAGACEQMESDFRAKWNLEP
jgi:hypothetical protein